MTGFFSRLEARARQIDSLLCVGLDPHTADLSAPTAAAARDFCLRLIEATADQAAAFKPNAAFFEALGPDGWAVLREVIAAAPEGVPMILDAKRGDIASTAEAYAQSAFAGLGADAITLSPYLGRDSLTPFLADPQRGVFLLCKTSNPGAADLQDLALAGAQPDACGSTWPIWPAPGTRTTTWGWSSARPIPTRCAGCARSRRSCGSSRRASAHRAASWMRPCAPACAPMAWGCSSR